MREFGIGPGRLKVWEVKTGTLKHDLVGYSSAKAVAFSPDGNLLAGAGRWLSDRESGTGVIVWRPNTGTRIRNIEIPCNGRAYSVALSPDSKLMAVSTQDFDLSKADAEQSSGKISLIHAASGVMTWRQMVPGWAATVAFLPDGKSIAVLCGGSRHGVNLLDTDTGQVKCNIESPDFLYNRGRWGVAMGVAPQANLLVLGGVVKDKQGCVEVWDFNAVPATPR